MSRISFALMLGSLNIWGTGHLSGRRPKSRCAKEVWPYARAAGAFQEGLEGSFDLSQEAKDEAASEAHDGARGAGDGAVAGNGRSGFLPAGISPRTPHPPADGA